MVIAAGLAFYRGWKIHTGETAILAYGLGFFVQRKAVDGGSSVGSFGHHGARKTKMWIEPQNGIVMVLMVQCNELTHNQEHDLYAAFHKQATVRFGKVGKRDSAAQ